VIRFGIRPSLRRISKPINGGGKMEEDFDFPDDDEEDFCDCEDFDADLLEGRARCFRCGRSWWMSNDEIIREIRWQAEMIECAEATTEE
jgi:hypothetical protein